MNKISAELFDIDERNDPFLSDYEYARSLIQTSNWSHGLEKLEELARQGSIMSILLISDAMRDGWLYDQDLSGAESWYQVAVEAGSARGLFGLGLVYLKMNRIGEAVRNLEAAITENYPPAYNALAIIHFRGDGIPVDRERALWLWRTGASLGHLPAKKNLVKQYIRGRYGLWCRIVGLLNLLPTAIEITTVRAANRYTDRLR